LSHRVVSAGRHPVMFGGRDVCAHQPEPIITSPHAVDATDILSVAQNAIVLILKQRRQAGRVVAASLAKRPTFAIRSQLLCSVLVRTRTHMTTVPRSDKTRLVACTQAAFAFRNSGRRARVVLTARTL